MAQYPNRVKGKADTSPELLIKSWNTLNEAKLVRAQLGASFDTIIEWVVDNETAFNSYNPTPSMYMRVQPGNIGGTYLEAFRNMNLVNLNEVAIPKILACFPFSFFKPGTNSADYADLNNDIIDPGTYVGLVFKDANLIYSFAPKGVFYSCTFKTCTLRNSDWTARSLQNCLVEDCQMDYMKLMDTAVTFYDQDPFYFYTTFRRCKMNYIEGERLATSHCLFEECEINNSSFARVSANTWNEYTTYRKCQINYSTIGLGGPDALATIFEECEVRFSRVEGSDSDSYGGLVAESSDFEGSTLHAVSIKGRCTNNSFRNVTFSPDSNAGLEIEDANITGSDFTGSNLDSFFAAKQDLINAGVTYDEDTLWVDGTPLGD